MSPASNSPIAVIDTNVLIDDPNCFMDDTFAAYEAIYIPEVVLTELEKFKKEDSARGWATRTVANNILQLCQLGDINCGVANAHDVSVKIIGTAGNGSSLLDGWNPEDPDHLILKTAAHLQKTLGNREVILITSDKFLSAKASRCHVKYRSIFTPVDTNVYTGQSQAYCGETIFQKLVNSSHWQISPHEFYTYHETAAEHLDVCGQLTVNEFLVIHNELNPKAVTLGRFDGENIVNLTHLEDRPCSVTPLSITQKFMQEALMTDGQQQRLVLFEGPAGTAKTFYSLAVGSWAIDNQLVEKFNVTRANVEADKSFGYLPGSIEEKFDGFLNPIYDNLKQLVKIDRRTRYKDGKVIKEDTDKEYLIKEVFGIQPVPLNYMRGRTLPHRFILVDEAQNLDRAQAKMIVTRAGEGTVVVFAGDITQIDDVSKVNKFNNGLSHAIKTMVGDPLCYFLRLANDDNQRSNLSHAAAQKM